MSDKNERYEELKNEFRSSAMLFGGSSETVDPYEFIMSDSDRSRQPLFFRALMHNDDLALEDRQLLMDGLAREYAGCDGWMDYVDQVCRDL